MESITLTTQNQPGPGLVVFGHDNAVVFADSIAGLLLISAYWHIFLRPGQTERWLSARSTVRFVGGLLLLLAVSCLWWNGWFFKDALSVSLAVSGLWRFCFPDHSIRAQRAMYSRWVHGCLLLE